MTSGFHCRKVWPLADVVATTRYWLGQLSLQIYAREALRPERPALNREGTHDGVMVQVRPRATVQTLAYDSENAAGLIGVVLPAMDLARLRLLGKPGWVN